MFTQLAKTAAELAIPADYFSGVRAEALCLPENVLLFYRDSFSNLQQQSLENRSHHRFVLFMVLETACSVSIDGVEYRLEPGQALLIFPYQFHIFLNPDNGRMGWLILTFETNSPATLDVLKNRIVALDSDAYERIGKLLETYPKSNRKAISGNPTILRAALLLDLLRRRVSPVEVVGNPAEPRVPLESGKVQAKEGDAAGAVLLSRINHWLHARTGGIPLISDLAQSIGLSESLLRHRFRANFGISLGAYLHDFQLTRAARLLTQTSQTMTEIAVECGYGSLASFSRAFRTNTGSSPRAYRQRHRFASVS
ncbi:MAG: AraC family transcriptional regulator [Puniceicoccales bacterium]|jgi:AraC-like DNA-binding protein/quercetin dioxygenase-like cupin family protein|nr:AraC family transcriptional regulator [Puniceicoccales bacterium]